MEKYPDVERHISTLFFEQRSIGTHAGGVLICPGLEKHMPIIGVRGRLQTSWTEGMNFRNLEDNGFLKFDFLGLTLLLDIENCIRRILQNAGNKNPSFSDITKFFDDNLNCRYNTCEDQRVYDYVFKGTAKTGVFQFTACLTGNTMITMADRSEKRLDKISSCDNILSYNVETNIFEVKNVTEFIDQGNKQCLELTLENGKTITCTLDHKFYTNNRGWVEAKDLLADDDIMSL
jgi:hypothetical protein